MTGVFNVFLSYAREDAAPADKLRRLLAARPDVRLFSVDDLTAGEDWQAKLREAVVRSDVFVLLVSPNSLASSWVLQELGAAWLLNKRIIPVLAGARPIRLPVELQGAQSANLSDLRTPGDFDPWFEPQSDSLAVAK